MHLFYTILHESKLHGQLSITTELLKSISNSLPMIHVEFPTKLQILQTVPGQVLNVLGRQEVVKGPSAITALHFQVSLRNDRIIDC